MGDQGGGGSQGSYYEVGSVLATSSQGTWADSDQTHVRRSSPVPAVTLSKSFDGTLDVQTVIRGNRAQFRIQYKVVGGMRGVGSFQIVDPLAPDCNYGPVNISSGTTLDLDYTCTGQVIDHSYTNSLTARYNVISFGWLRQMDSSEVVVVPPLVSVGDYVWFDHDRDGLQGDSEAGAPDVTVRLLDAGGAEVATTTTDATGFYSFGDLSADTDYVVEFVRPSGFEWTVSDAGADDVDSDVDPATNRIAFHTPASGSNQLESPDLPTLDAGVYAYNLTLAKTLVGSRKVEVGDVVRFRLTPANAGPSDALAGWSVTELLPKGLKLVSMSGPGYRCHGLTCVADSGLKAGASGSVITVKAKVLASAAGKERVNIAYVSPSGEDGSETNPLVVPSAHTDTAASKTDNDAEAPIKVRDVQAVSPNEDGVLPQVGMPQSLMAVLLVALGSLVLGSLALGSFVLGGALQRRQ